ncbi:putative nuclease HARBI1 [Palaemon carinicauda]|uniref:putative nuclease HARBI1 n=1 Tax=Palaemon carinicauda TaxID=392227 RepID=UPI0035B62A25
MTPSKRKISAVMVIALLHDEYEHDICKKSRKVWMKPWLRKRENFYHMTLLKELKENNPEDYRNYLRMTDNAFRDLLSLVSPKITKKDTVMRKSIPAEERLIATLRFLATGRSLEDLKFSTGISAQALGHIISETCQAIYDALRNEYLKFPTTSGEWKKIADDFYLLWNFPNCGGAIDGKHVSIVPPSNSGSYYFNYKGYFSVVLMAIVNANLEFLMVDVGKNGRISDGGIIEDTVFYKKLIEGTLNLPQNNETKYGLNFVFIGDEAFALHEHLQNPFPQRELTYEKKIYNYRLSRARRVVENAFGVLSNVFRVFHTSIALKPEKIDRVVLASCVLHNFLRRNCRNSYTPLNMTDFENIESGIVSDADWRKDSNDAHFTNLQALGQRNASDAAKNARLSYVAYFNGDGKVPWQDRLIK